MKVHDKSICSGGQTCVGSIRDILYCNTAYTDFGLIGYTYKSSCQSMSVKDGTPRHICKNNMNMSIQYAKHITNKRQVFTKKKTFILITFHRTEGDPISPTVL